MLEVSGATEVSGTAEVMAKNIAEKLHKEFPGHLWAVHVQGGLVNVLNLALSGRWGFTLKPDKSYSASDLDRQVVRAGGEILERYRLARAKFNRDRYAELKPDFAGNLAHD